MVTPQCRDSWFTESEHRQWKVKQSPREKEISNCIHAKNQINSNIWKRMVTNEAPPQTPCCGTVSQLSVGLLPQSKPCYLDISCWLPVVHQLRNLHIFVISNCRLLCQQERVSINGLMNLKIQFSPCLYLVDIYKPWFTLRRYLSWIFFPQPAHSCGPPILPQSSLTAMIISAAASTEQL